MLTKSSNTMELFGPLLVYDYESALLGFLEMDIKFSEGTVEIPVLIPGRVNPSYDAVHLEVILVNFTKTCQGYALRGSLEEVENLEEFRKIGD